MDDDAEEEEKAPAKVRLSGPHIQKMCLCNVCMAEPVWSQSMCGQVQAGKRPAAAAPKTPQPQKKPKLDVKEPKSAPAKVQGKGKPHISCIISDICDNKTFLLSMTSLHSQAVHGYTNFASSV